MTFSEVLNKYKSALNLTQSALAEICGTSPAVISRYLNGKRLPEKDSDIIKSIAKGIAEKSKDFPALNLSAKDIEKELNGSLLADDKENDFYVRLDALLKDKNVSNTELSKVLPYDASYISRVRNKKRIPKDQEEFLTQLEKYLNESPTVNTKEEIEAETPTEPIAKAQPVTPADPKEEYNSIPKSPTRRPRQTRFEYFLEKVSSYIEDIKNINLPL